MNFFFTGMKHSGKTTFAKRVAAAKGLIWADSDDLVLENIKPLTVREYYKKYGKEKTQKLINSAIEYYVK